MNLLSVRCLNRKSVKPLRIDNLKAKLLKSQCQDAGLTVNAQGDFFKTFWSVINRVHACHHCKQYLSCTNIRGGFFASNMLLSRLKSKTVGRIALRINRYTHQATRHASLKSVFCSKISSRWSAKTHGYTKALRTSNRNISAPLSWRSKQCQSQ